MDGPRQLAVPHPSCRQPAIYSRNVEADSTFDIRQPLRHCSATVPPLLRRFPLSMSTHRTITHSRLPRMPFPDNGSLSGEVLKLRYVDLSKMSIEVQDIKTIDFFSKARHFGQKLKVTIHSYHGFLSPPWRCFGVGDDCLLQSGNAPLRI